MYLYIIIFTVYTVKAVVDTIQLHDLCLQNAGPMAIETVKNHEEPKIGRVRHSRNVQRTV